MLVSVLTNMIRSGIGNDATTDVIYEWVARALDSIHSMPWPHTHKITPVMALEPLTYEGEYFAPMGSSTIQILSGDVPPATSVGRTLVVYGTSVQCYRIRRVNSASIILDAPLESELEVESLTLARDRYAFRTDNIFNVSAGRIPKLLRFDRQLSVNLADGAWHETSAPGVTSGYIDTRERLEVPPLPLTVAASGTGTLPVGRYIYAATRYCSESGMESLHGEATVYTSTGTVPTVEYPGTLDTGHQIRVYRSDVDPTTDAPAMMLVGTITVPASGTTIRDETGSINRTGLRYYEGTLTTIELYPTPQEKTLLRVDHSIPWGIRLSVRDNIDVGPTGMFLDLIRLYCASRSASSQRDVGSEQIAMAKFGAQLNYVLRRSQSSGDTDVTAGMDDFNGIVDRSLNSSGQYPETMFLPSSLRVR